MKDKKRIVYFIHFTEDDPFSRYRYYAVHPYLENYDFDVKVYPLFSAGSSKKMYQNGKQPKPALMACWQRIFQLFFLGKNDIVYIQYPLLSQGFYSLEKWLLRRRKHIVTDWVDTSFYRRKEEKNSSKPIFLQDASLYNTFVTATSSSTRQLLTHAEKVVGISACVMVNDYLSITPARLTDTEQQPFRIGWLGSTETSSFLLLIKDCLFQLHDLYNIQLVLIGFDKKLEKELQGLPFVNYAKQFQSAVSLLKACDAGVMPIPPESALHNNPLFDMIQYMACGLPVVASSTEVSIAISHGNDNLFVRTIYEWYSCLAAMIQNQSFYKEVGKNNQLIVSQHYSVEAAQKSYLSLFQNITGA